MGYKSVFGYVKKEKVGEIEGCKKKCFTWVSFHFLGFSWGAKGWKYYC